jgi:hypothetical protein
LHYHLKLEIHPASYELDVSSSPLLEQLIAY